MRVKRIVEIALILFKLINKMYGVNYSSSFIILLLLLSHYSSVRDYSCSFYLPNFILCKYIIHLFCRYFSKIKF